MAPNVKVAPGIADYTHHVSFTNRRGEKIGLILCDDKGQVVDPKDAFREIPVDRSALKTSSGNSSYSDMVFPYGPIVQLDFSGGRGQLDFETDATKFYDSSRLRTGRQGKAYLGPQEQYTKGYRNQDFNVPGNVRYIQLLGANKFVAKRFRASATYNVSTCRLRLRVRGRPGPARIAVYIDNAGQLSMEITHIDVPYTVMADTLAEWINQAVTAGLNANLYYWIGISSIAASPQDNTQNHWEFAADPQPVTSTTYSSSVGGAWTNWSAASYDLYFHLTDAILVNKTAIFYEYMEQQYLVVSDATGAPQVFMNGDRGASDPNLGGYEKLVDATKAWIPNEHAGSIVLLTEGPGSEESEPWRKIVSNTATELFLEIPFFTEHTTATSYAIIASASWRELTGHGLTAPVTDILVSPQGVVYFAQGDNVNLRRHREYNNAGVWTESDWADDGTNKATFLIYKPQAQKIFRAQNDDGTASHDVGLSSADVQPWNTNLIFSALTKVGSKYRRITSLEIYPENNGNEAVWVGKTDRPWIVPTTGNPYPLALKEMENFRSPKNFRAHLVENVYLFFSFGNGVERYYSGTLDDIGPNLGEGLPAGRQGAILAMSGYPGRFFAAVDAGLFGYSSLLEYGNGGWHERYRAPKGVRIIGVAHQVIPGPLPDRLWLYVGNDVIWLPMPSDTTNELEDPNYRYVEEGALILSRMHAGMFDVQKLVALMKFGTRNLSDGNRWLEVDYKLGEDIEWNMLGEEITQSPKQVSKLRSIFGLAGTSIQLRIRFYTTNAAQTPILQVVILDAVLREEVKYMYSFFALVEDRQKLLGSDAFDDFERGIDKINALKSWADASTDSMLVMNALSPLCDDVLVFLNPPETKAQAYPTSENPDQKNVYLVSLSAQEA